jgi:hypothetical protein
MAKHACNDPENDACYPPYVVTPENLHHWDFCEQMSDDPFADLEPVQRREQVWSATRAFYQSDIPI